MTYTNLFTFYRSSEWEQFRKALLAERLERDGEIIDDVTGKPIVKAYDVILHHVTPLTEQNVFDADIALNPDNIQVVSHRTHNEIHNRFGSWQRHIYIVYGSPCSGKSTWVDSVATKDDLIIDIDRIYNAINNHRGNRVYTNVMALYRSLIDMVKTRNGTWNNVFIVRGFPLRGERERLAQQLDAELIHIDTDKETCLERSYEKAPDYHKHVEDWWNKYQA